MNTRRKLAAIFAVVVVAAGAYVIGRNTAPTTTPSLTPKITAPLSCVAAPTTFASGTTFTAPTNACYTIPANGIKLTDVSNVTIIGGLWTDNNNKSCPFTKCAQGSQHGRPAFKLVDTNGVKMENMSISGINTGGYKAPLAANDGIELAGAMNTTLSHVSVGHVFGSCLNLEGSRSGVGSNGVVNPVSNLVATGLSLTACGNQGVALVSVNGAVFTDTTIGTVGQHNPWDFEDDSGGEGAKNVAINGCTDNGLVNITADGQDEGPISVSHCVSDVAVSGDAIRIANLDGAAMAGVVSFTDDTLRCGASSAVSCIQLKGPDVINITGSSLQIGFNHDTLHERLYTAVDHSILTFSGDTVSGVWHGGRSDATSKVVGAP